MGRIHGRGDAWGWGDDCYDPFTGRLVARVEKPDTVLHGYEAFAYARFVGDMVVGVLGERLGGAGLEIFTMLVPVHHPVMGDLVPDQWNRDLLMFRRFPHMKPFWRPEPANALNVLSPRERVWVQNWEQHGAQLARICRDANIHYALRSLGVFEVVVDPGTGGRPSEAQAETYRLFVDQEASICRNALSALLRYYRHTRQAFPDWYAGEDYPDATTIEELAPYVRFDGIGIGRRAAHGLCPVTLGWEPDWDMEHKLLMTLYRDQVLEIGCAAGGSLLLWDPEDYLTAPNLVWGPGQMDEDERSALQEFVEGYESESEVDEE